jgi:hypothetical protein
MLPRNVEYVTSEHVTLFLRFRARIAQTDS